MRIVILGGTGYLGSKLSNNLIQNGHDVWCLTRNSISTKKGIVKDKLHFISLEKWLIEEDEQRFDCFVNAACKYPRNANGDYEIFEANMNVPLQVFFKLANKNIKKMITIGTGLPDEFNTYAFSKKKFVETCKWYNEQVLERNKKISICNVELENFYGEDEPKDRFIPETIDKLKKNQDILLTEGFQKRDFIYVEDVISVISELIERKDMPEYIDLPLGTGVGVTIRELMEYLKKIVQSSSKLCFGAIEKRKNEPDSVADCTKLNELGMQAQWSWQDGMKRMCQVEEIK